MTSRGRPFVVESRVRPIELVRWWEGRDRGLSSEAIALRFTYGEGPDDYPLDPSDLGRCERLMRTVPEIRGFLPEMAAVSPVWAALVARWSDIVALAESEVPGCFDDQHAYGTAPATYALMRDLIDAAPRLAHPSHGDDT
jgi:hypothetical protein